MKKKRNAPQHMEQLRNIGHIGKFTKKKSHESQKRLMKALLMKQSMTATQIALKLNIYRPNVCQYKAELEREGSLQVINHVVCPVTHYSNVQLLSCNTDLFIANPQLGLFEQKGGGNAAA